MKTEFDSYSEGYDAGMDVFLKRISGETQVQFLLPKLQVIKKLFPSTEEKLKILDFGCGTGDFTALLAQTYPHSLIHGSDISCGMLEQARKLFPDLRNHFFHFEPGQESTILGAGVYDLVVAVCVFHHIPPSEWLKSMESIRNLLNPKGSFLLVEHNPWNPGTRWIVSRAAIDKNAVLLSIPTASRQMKAAGMHIKECHNILFFPPRIPFSALVDKWLRKIPLGGQYALHGVRNIYGDENNFH
jgi:SAM-dependent methyltransferase